jgi:hypothetical protein
MTPAERHRRHRIRLIEARIRRLERQRKRLKQKRPRKRTGTPGIRTGGTPAIWPFSFGLLLGKVLFGGKDDA